MDSASTASKAVAQAAGSDEQEELSDLDLVIGSGEPRRVGGFRFLLDRQCWEWSDAVARMHGYEPGKVMCSTELLLRQQHPDDRQQVAAVLERVLQG